RNLRDQTKSKSHPAREESPHEQRGRATLVPHAQFESTTEVYCQSRCDATIRRVRIRSDLANEFGRARRAAARGALLERERPLFSESQRGPRSCESARSAASTVIRPSVAM